MKSARNKITFIKLVILIEIIAAKPAFSGGLDSATMAATTFKTWFYAFAGVLAVCHLLYKGMEAWTDRAHWSDFGIAIGKVAAVGAVVVVAPWAWNLFVS